MILLEKKERGEIIGSKERKEDGIKALKQQQKKHKYKYKNN